MAGENYNGILKLNFFGTRLLPEQAEFQLYRFFLFEFKFMKTPPSTSWVSKEQSKNILQYA